MQLAAALTLSWFVAAAPDESVGVLVENVTIIDVRAEAKESAHLRDRSVLIRGNRIKKVGIASEIKVDEGVLTIDGTGKFLVPGLWDMHAHVHWPGEDTTEIVLPLMFAHGVTGLRDMTSDNSPPAKTLHEIREIQASIESGERRAPRILALCKRINGERRASLIRRMSVAPQSRIQGMASARLAKLNGCDFIKVYSGLPRAAFFGLMEEAKRLELPVAGHLPQGVSPVEASNAGMRSIEHARFPALACGPDYEEWRAAYAAFMANEADQNPGGLYRKNLASVVASFDEAECERILEVFLKNETHLCPTYTTRKMDAFARDPEYRTDPRRKYIAAHRLVQWDRDLNRTAAVPDSLAEDFRAFFKLGLRVTGMAHRKGVRVLVGTDTYDTHVFPGFSYHDELEHFQQAGMSPLAILRAATLHAAEFLEKEQDFGSVEAGRMADLVLLTKDPLESIGNTRTIHTLIFDGKTYSREYLDGMLEGVLKHVAPASPQFALWDASIKGDEEALKNALGEGANVNGLDTRGNPNGRRALNYAVIRDDTQLIKLLLDHGADVNLANRNGFTPLHHAAEFGAFDSAKLLIERGADVGLKTKRGWTPLRIAESRRRNQVADAIRQVSETADNHSQ